MRCGLQAGARSAASTFNEGEYDVSVPHLTGAEQRRVLHHIQVVDHGAPLKQQLHCAHVARQGGCMERCADTRAKAKATNWHHLAWSITLLLILICPLCPLLSGLWL